MKKIGFGVVFALCLAIPSWRLLTPLTVMPDESDVIWVETGQLILLYAYVNMTALGLGRLTLGKFRALSFYMFYIYILYSVSANKYYVG